MAGVKAYMDSEQAALEKAKETLEAVEFQTKRLQHMKENLPASNDPFFSLSCDV